MKKEQTIKIGKGVLVILLIALVTFPLVSADQTQKFNKIYLNPFYKQNMNKNTNYNYNITINPADKISSIKSAIINFQLWLNPTVNFDLTVNGQSCNNPSFQVHTTYANAGEGSIFFDCSNVITKAGTYNVVLTPSKNTGAITGWADITYQNNPDGKADIHGTEYVSNQNGTTFLQLRDSKGLLVDNGSCDLTVYYPDKTAWLQGVPMTHLNNGLYYYDFVTPDETGVYMVAVYCAYDVEDYVYSPPLTLSYDGNLVDRSTGSISEVQFSDGVFLRTDHGHYQQFNFVDNGIGNLNLSNTNLLKITWIGQNEKDKTYLQAYNFNTASWDNIGSSFIRSKDKNGEQKNSHGVSREITSNIQDYVNGNEVRVRVDLPTETKHLLTDYIEISFSSEGESVNNIRGSGEIHVSPRVWDNSYTPLENRIVNQTQVVNVVNQSSQDIWNYPNRTLTNFNFSINADVNETAIAKGVWDYNGTINSNILSQFATSVWAYTGRTLTSFGSLVNNIWSNPTRNLTFYPTPNSLTAQDVWNYNNRNLTSTEDVTDYSQIFSGVWNYNNRTLSSNFNYSLMQKYLWNSSNRVLTYYPTPNNLSSSDVWGYSSRTLTDYNQSDLTNYTKINNEIPTNVWNYVNRNLTFFPSQQDLTNYTKITNEVWSNPTRVLTYYPTPNNLTAEGVWNFSNRNLTFFPSENNISPSDIWNYNNRNLTYYPTQQDLTNYSLINSGVWNYVNRNLTFYPTPNSLTAQDIWDYNNRTLSEFNFSVVNNSAIIEGVWNYKKGKYTNGVKA